MLFCCSLIFRRMYFINLYIQIKIIWKIFFHLRWAIVLLNILRYILLVHMQVNCYILSIFIERICYDFFLDRFILLDVNDFDYLLSFQLILRLIYFSLLFIFIPIFYFLTKLSLTLPGTFIVKNTWPITRRA